jgi:hypothetical protein
METGNQSFKQRTPTRCIVAQILEFIRRENSCFDPEMIVVLGAAYDKALRSLHDRGQPEVVREVIARRIIDLAKKGEHDPERLCNAALTAINGRRTTDDLGR